MIASAAQNEIAGVASPSQLGQAAPPTFKLETLKMRIARGAFLAWSLGAALASIVTTSWAADGTGLTPSADTPAWSRWQGRISFTAAAPVWHAGLGGYETAGLRAASVSVLGDYYFTAPLLGGSGGFRATSGVIVGLRAQPGRSEPDATVDTLATPYVGLGYTGLSPHGAWRYSADLGLIGQSLGNSTVRFGRAQGSNPDDLQHDTRLGPSLQLGVSYSF